MKPVAVLVACAWLMIVNIPAAMAAAPVAVDDQAAGAEIITVRVFDNDTDPDGDLDPDTATVISGPSTGSAQWVGAGNGRKLRYSAPSGFIGVDLLTYRVCDTTAACDTAVVTLTVNGGTTTTTTTTTLPPVTTTLPPPTTSTLPPTTTAPPNTTVPPTTTAVPSPTTEPGSTTLVTIPSTVAIDSVDGGVEGPPQTAGAAGDGTQRTAWGGLDGVGRGFAGSPTAPPGDPEAGAMNGPPGTDAGSGSVSSGVAAEVTAALVANALGDQRSSAPTLDFAVATVAELGAVTFLPALLLALSLVVVRAGGSRRRRRGTVVAVLGDQGVLEDKDGRLYEARVSSGGDFAPGDSVVYRARPGTGTATDVQPYQATGLEPTVKPE